VNRILFVDDEPNVLAGLKRMLYSLRNEWDMTFVSSGAEALQCLSESPFDVLVTDVRMPEMNGVELLEQVVNLHPELIRIVLSGTADIELTMQCVSLSHQYLLKPCDAQTLRATVQRAFCLRVLLYNPALRGLISQIQSLPSIPAVYGELTTVLRSDDASPQAVGRIMARDMGMTAKVLQLVNSAFFGVSREITNPVDAVVYLGMETVRALVFTASAFSQFHLRDRCHFSIEELQQHSLAVGTLARQIAKSMGLIPAAVTMRSWADCCTILASWCWLPIIPSNTRRSFDARERVRFESATRSATHSARAMPKSEPTCCGCGVFQIRSRRFWLFITIPPATLRCHRPWWRFILLTRWSTRNPSRIWISRA